MEKKKKKFEAPNLLVLIVSLIIFASLLTYIIPAGEYDLNEAGSVIAGTFHFTEKSPVNPIRAFSMIFDGLNASSYVIFIVMLMGGSISAILSHGAVENIISYSIYRLNGKNTLLPVIGCMVLMSLLASIGGSDAFVAFVPVGVIVAKKLRLDPISAVAMFFMSSFVGFSMGPFCMTTQTIAGVPVFSGFFLRSCVLIFMTAWVCVYVAVYCKRILKDPSKSLMGNDAWIAELDEPSASQQEQKLDMRAVASMLLLIISFVIIAIVMPLMGLGYGELMCIFFFLVIISGLIYGQSLSEIANGFVQGCMQMAAIGIIIGFAKTIGLVLEEGNILHSIVYYITIPLGAMGSGLASVFLVICNSIINLFIPSGSGEAAVVIPLMLPIGEVLNIPAQVIVSAFTYGDGLTNLCIPTFSVLMGSLMIAKVPYGKWMKFVTPFILISFLFIAVLMFVLTSIGWTGL